MKIASIMYGIIATLIHVLVSENDAATATGASPEKVAKLILKAVLRDEDDITIAPIAPRVAYWIRHLCPPLYFWIMARRAQKIDSTANKDD